MTKKIRVLVTAMVEIESELPVEEAIEDFEANCMYTFEDTDEVTVIQTEWRETKKISVAYERLK